MPRGSNPAAGGHGAGREIAEQEQAEHEKIFTAVEAGDAEAAGELMRAHLQNINAEMRSASMASEGSLWG